MPFHVRSHLDSGAIKPYLCPTSDSPIHSSKPLEGSLLFTRVGERSSSEPWAHRQGAQASIAFLRPALVDKNNVSDDPPCYLSACGSGRSISRWAPIWMVLANQSCAVEPCQIQSSGRHRQVYETDAGHVWRSSGLRREVHRAEVRHVRQSSGLCREVLNRGGLEAGLRRELEKCG